MIYVVINSGPLNNGALLANEVIKNLFLQNPEDPDFLLCLDSKFIRVNMYEQ